jgi:uncharacterized membrane protein YozB (DUF420 family)
VFFALYMLRVEESDNINFQYISVDFVIYFFLLTSPLQKHFS